MPVIKVWLEIKTKILAFGIICTMCVTSCIELEPGPHVENTNIIISPGDIIIPSDDLIVHIPTSSDTLNVIMADSISVMGGSPKIKPIRSSAPYSEFIVFGIGKGGRHGISSGIYKCDSEFSKCDLLSSKDKFLAAVNFSSDDQIVALEKSSDPSRTTSDWSISLFDTNGLKTYDFELDVNSTYKYTTVDYDPDVKMVVCAYLNEEDPYKSGYVIFNIESGEKVLVENKPPSIDRTDFIRDRNIILITDFYTRTIEIFNVQTNTEDFSFTLGPRSDILSGFSAHVVDDRLVTFDKDKIISFDLENFQSSYTHTDFNIRYMNTQDCRVWVRSYPDVESSNNCTIDTFIGFNIRDKSISYRLNPCIPNYTYKSTVFVSLD